jgi:hypothetical protein
MCRIAVGPGVASKERWRARFRKIEGIHHPAGLEAWSENDPLMDKDTLSRTMLIAQQARKSIH